MEMREILKEQSGQASTSYVAQLLEKWNPLLKGIKNDYTRGSMAVLFENQASHLRGLDEDTRTTNVGEFLKYVFPVLRRVWPNLIANEIVSVQPMTAPVGGVFYFELKYGNTKGSVQASTNMIQNFNAYYSSETIDHETIGTGTGGSGTFSSTLDYVPVRQGTVKVYAGAVSGVDSTANVISGTGISGTVDYTTGTISVTCVAGAGVDVYATYEYNMECNETVPQINLDIQLQEVRAKTRKLKALWCSEAADDLKAFHGIDAEAELVAGIAAEIALEIDREVITDLYQGATGGTGTWSYTLPQGISEVDHVKTLITVISKLSNQIHKQSLRGPANFIVTSPEVCSLLEQLSVHGDFRPLYAPMQSEPYVAAEQPNTFGVMKVGTIHQKWVVYKDPYFTTNKLLLGYKGPSFLDAGYVWAPYVPLQMTATFLDPNDFSFRKGLRTRYAKKMVRPEFYGTIAVSNLP